MAQSEGDKIDEQVQENLANWQTSNNPLAPISDGQVELIYEIGDLVKSEFTQTDESDFDELTADTKELDEIPQIDTRRAYIKWLISAEDQIKHEDLKEYEFYYNALCNESSSCEKLYDYVNVASNYLGHLREKYLEVTAKTDSLHNLSEQLMLHQKILKEAKKNLSDKLHYFLIFNATQENVDRLSTRVPCQDYINLLNNIDEAIEYLNEHINFKESRIYKMKYESLLATTLNNIYKCINDVLIETTKQVTDPRSKHYLVSLNTTDTSNNSKTDSAVLLYYGKFQNAAKKMKLILVHLEEKATHNEQYKNCINDCQRSYVDQRLPLLSTAVSNALSDLRDKYRTDYSVLFRSCGNFTMKICQDEKKCYHYFFDKYSSGLDDYLGILCQHLYDILRPSLIGVNHVEVLSELCGILRKELLNDKAYSDEHLSKYCETIKQLLQDVEERLVFRTNIFFQYDLMAYNPSPGDLAYPEKLKQLENITDELSEFRPDSRSSLVSLESQEVANINNSNQIIRSYTGNSPADLHGMWYPTVKRTLVILSRLYFCLEKETFQGLAQEALLVCIQTIERATNLISQKKSEVDARLFQIKHLLIIREQIAPFQVDFTVKEMSLDFSTVHKAALDLIHHRNKLFTFGSNNALLEFLLEGTPKVKEYLIDSRKEIDKQLKYACEYFINFVALCFTGVMDQWRKNAEEFIQKSQSGKLSEQRFGKAQMVAKIVSETLRTMKLKIPDTQKSMQLYLANRETEFILFRPIKNNVLNNFIQIEQVVSRNYNREEQLLIACPTPEQVNVLICSVSLTNEQDSSVSSLSKVTQ